MDTKSIIKTTTFLMIMFHLVVYSQKVSTLISDFSSRTIEALSIDKYGNLYTPSGPAGAVYKINRQGGETASIIASGLSFPQGGTTDKDGNIYISVWSTGVIVKIDEEGILSNFATSLRGPTGLVVDKSGSTMYASNYSSNSISKIDMETKAVTNFVSGNGINGPDGLVFDEKNNLYSANFNDNKILKISSEGNVELFAVLPGSNSGYITYAKNNLYAAGHKSHKIFKISLGGDVSELAGSGVAGYKDGDLISAQFNTPNGIVASLTGDSLFVADAINKVIRVIELKSETTNINSDDEQIKNEFSLNQNYPNPFNPSTTISYYISKRTNLSIKVYDSLGNIIKELYNGEKEKGNYSIEFSSENLTSGIYYYTVVTPKTSITKKMVLLK